MSGKNVKTSTDKEVEAALPDAPAEVEGYLILSDLKYGGKKLSPGSRSPLSELSADQIQRFKDGKVIE